jgi:hypothetical protein
LYISSTAPMICPPILSLHPLLKAIARDFIVLFHANVWSPSTYTLTLISFIPPPPPFFMF